MEASEFLQDLVIQTISGRVWYFSETLSYPMKPSVTPHNFHSSFQNFPHGDGHWLSWLTMPSSC